ncbi:MAG: hypothetical protein HYX20_01370 [Candidatus Yanofskybacteria bacterium]|nr:hypothetical protein [Candidatus Yanofskybacteria bacterium]
MNSVADDFSRAVKAQSIIEGATPTVFLVAYFGGALVAGVFASALGLREMSQVFTLFPICAIGVGVMWWCLREVPKRRKAFEKLETLYPQLSNTGKKLRGAEAAIAEVRVRVIASLEEMLQPIGPKRYSGLFLDGGRFEIYHGKVPPMSKAHRIMEVIRKYAKERNLKLPASFVLGMFDTEPCVHVFVLGEDLYFG